MKKRLVPAALLGLSLLAGLLGLSPLANAATDPSQGTGQALEIAPPLITLRGNPGQTLNSKIQLRDVSSVDLLVTNQINDFVANGEDGTPKILTGDDSNNPFSMKNWIDPLEAFTLKPQKIVSLPITIRIPANASPGGHYGVIRFTGTPPQLHGQGVSLSASLGALVLLTVNGDITDNLSITQFATTHVPPAQNPNNPQSVSPKMKPASLFESPPLQFVIKFKNTGNIQEEPVGHILISNMFGKAVIGMNVNLDQRNVLPGSTREFDALLDDKALAGKRLFGRYHAVITVNYGVNTHKTITAGVTFWVIPWKLIIAIIILLIAAFFVLRFMLRRYNQRIIRKVQGGNIPPARSKKAKKK